MIQIYDYSECLARTNTIILPIFILRINFLRITRFLLQNFFNSDEFLYNNLNIKYIHINLNYYSYKEKQTSRPGGIHLSNETQERFIIVLVIQILKCSDDIRQ